jgi:mono/diheme cytochrome c family protein
LRDLCAHEANLQLILESPAIRRFWADNLENIKEKTVKKASLLKTALLSLLMIPALSGVASAADRVGDFALLDQDGYYHSMSWYNDREAIALLVQANDSQATDAAISEFDALKAKYGSQGIEFMMINPMGEMDRAAVQAKVADYGVDIPVLMDDARVISEALGIERTGEVLIYNPNSFRVEYRGSVAASEQAMQEILAGDDVSNALVATSGPSIAFAVAAVPSYSQDVAPVLAENCASCHRAGGIAPFAMDSHAMVQGWSPMIREVLMTKRMPPGQIDGHIGEFINDRIVDDADVRNIIAWAEAGAPNDGDVDPLAELTWSTSKWNLGDEPDYIIKVPSQPVPATGVLPYRDVAVVIDLDGKDRWLKGSEYSAGDPTVLHHTINRLDFPGEVGRGQLNGTIKGKASITAYVPGGTIAMNPPNTGGLIKDGSTLHLNLHYTTTGRETVDDSEIGLWFYPEGEEPTEQMGGQCACIFPNTWTNIPANDPNFEQVSTITVPYDAEIHSFLPHMHFRGKYMRFYADYPDGTNEELINISQFNYNWQMNYTYAEPKFVPEGTKITAVGAFDNSAQNPANPDPERTVPWGQQSWDEMFFGAVQWKELNHGGD